MADTDPVERSVDDLVREAHKALSLLQRLLPEIVQRAKTEAAKEVVARVVRAASEVPAAGTALGDMGQLRGSSGQRRNVKSGMFQMIVNAGQQGIPRERLREYADQRGVRPGSFRVALQRLLDSDVIEIDGILYLAKHAEAATGGGTEEEAAGASQGTPAASLFQQPDGGKHATALADSLN